MTRSWRNAAAAIVEAPVGVTAPQPACCRCVRLPRMLPSDEDEPKNIALSSEQFGRAWRGSLLRRRRSLATPSGGVASAAWCDRPQRRAVAPV